MIVSDALERMRLAEFAAYVGSDTGPDIKFRRITQLGRRLFDVPMAMVNLIDATDMWPKAEDGIVVGRAPRDSSLCNLVIQGGEIVVLPDLAADPRFRDLPAVTGADGLRFYAGAPVRTPTGQVLGVMCVLDHHPRPDFGPEQQQTLQTLAEIAMDQLILDRALRDAACAQKSAEQMSQARGSFLAMMSHEIRTPLNAILGFGDMLARSGLPEPQAEYARIVHETGQGLMQMLNHTLDYARLESGAMTLEEQLFRPGDILVHCLRLAERHCRENGVALTSQLDPTLPTRLRGDAGRLQQVLSNLAFNAAKFTEKGSVSVSLMEDGISPDGIIWLRAEVADTGIGVPVDQRNQLFTPFFQADASHSRRFGGSGLGLAICRQLAQVMGGVTGYQPRDGGGSLFWLRLPFTQVT